MEHGLMHIDWMIAGARSYTHEIALWIGAVSSLRQLETESSANYHYLSFGFMAQLAELGT